MLLLRRLTWAYNRIVSLSRAEPRPIGAFFGLTCRGHARSLTRGLKHAQSIICEMLGLQFNVAFFFSLHKYGTGFPCHLLHNLDNPLFQRAKNQSLQVLT
ncbi:hypothetical protein F4803DRAFT_530669 [Xylaria telfairii]|nr:hypothetical protein F4803DRAFT_530669 [Xylaria telfairii]